MLPRGNPLVTDLWPSSPSHQIPSLYVHFPFCESRCHYCDFYALGASRTRAEDPDRFQRALQREATRVAPQLCAPLSTVFFGGGTPSMTSAEAMAEALAPILEQQSSIAEWTLEANPSSLSAGSLMAYRKLGVNRLSLGVQAMRADHLELLGRVHSVEQVRQALGWAFASGLENVSVDLMCGIPGQRLADLEGALEQLTSEFPLTHLSCYLLSLPPHHRLYPQLPPEETQTEHLLFVDRWLGEAGFEHYEISNFARPGHRAQHNWLTWQGNSYLGLGPSAHSYDASLQKRWKNTSSLHRYVNSLQQDLSVVESEESLSPQQIQLERWMLRLRLSDGFPRSWLATRSQSARGARMEAEGFIAIHEQDPHRYRLTPRGFTIADSIVQSLCLVDGGD